MHEYDTVLKSLLQDPRNSVLEQIAGAPMGRLLNVELPEVQQTRVDLLFETSEEVPRLIGIELQSERCLAAAAHGRILAARLPDL